jgi:hypothetical protein
MMAYGATHSSTVIAWRRFEPAVLEGCWIVDEVETSTMMVYSRQLKSRLIATIDSLSAAKPIIEIAMTQANIPA